MLVGKQTNDYCVKCDDCIIAASEPCVESCLATLNTMDSKPYKNLLQDKLKEWYNLYAAVRPTPKAGRLSVASLGDGDDSADEDGAAARDEGGEGRIRGELPSL